MKAEHAREVSRNVYSSKSGLALLYYMNVKIKEAAEIGESDLMFCFNDHPARDADFVTLNLIDVGGYKVCRFEVDGIGETEISWR